MSSIVLNFNERELTLLSDSILTMIDNALYVTPNRRKLLIHTSKNYRH